MPHKILHSLYGRKFGLTSTGGMVEKNGAILDVVPINTAVSTSSTTIKAGFSNITSSATAANFLLDAPAENAVVEIYISATSSAVTINAEAAGFTIGTSSTAISWTSTTLKNQYVKLRGISSTWYALVSQSSLATLA